MHQTRNVSSGIGIIIGIVEESLSGRETSTRQDPAHSIRTRFLAAVVETGRVWESRLDQSTQKTDWTGVIPRTYSRYCRRKRFALMNIILWAPIWMEQGPKKTRSQPKRVGTISSLHSHSRTSPSWVWTRETPMQCEPQGRGRDAGVAGCR